MVAQRGAKVPSKIWQAGSCERCRGLGYHGRTGIFEIWQLDEADYNAILTGMDEHALRRQVREKNHGTMLDDGLEKARQGVTSIDALRNVADLLSLHALVDGQNEKKSSATSTRKRSNGSSTTNGKSKNGSRKRSTRSKGSKS